MRRFLLLPLLVALSLDFATLGGPLVQSGPRPVQLDDEEESAPSRPARLRRATPPLTAALPAHRYVAPARTRRLPENAVPADRRDHPPEWLVPISRARISFLGAASPPEDH